MVELARDRREVLQPDRNVAGGLLEQLGALVLGKCPQASDLVMGMSAAQVASGRPRPACLVASASFSSRWV